MNENASGDVAGDETARSDSADNVRQSFTSSPGVRQGSLKNCLWSCIDTIQQYFVEAALFSFFLARHMSLPLFQEYVQSQVFEQHHIDINRDATRNGSQNDEWRAAQHESAVVVLGLQVAEGLPAVVTVIILGAVSDRTGRRKILLWLPCLGSFAFSLIYILMLYTGWNIDGLFMASALRGLSGSMTAFLAGATFYAINSVKPHQRASRLAIQEFLNGGAYAVGNIMVGFWVKDNGFLQPFWFTVICSLIALLISFFLVQEIKIDTNNSQRQQSSGNFFKETFSPLAKYFRCCQNPGLIKMWLTILAFQTYAAVHIGQENTLVLYLSGQKYLYSWQTAITGQKPYVKIGLFLAVIMLVAAIATALVPPLLRRFVTETHIAAIGFVSKALGTLWIAVIRNETLLYFAILLLAFELLPFPMLRSLVSRRVAPADQGAVFAVMHCGESITYFLAPLTFTAVYASSLHYFSGFVFIFSIILLSLPVTFTGILHYLEMKQPGGYEPMDEGGDNQPPHDPPNVNQQQHETDDVRQSCLGGQSISFIQLNHGAAEV